VDDIDIVQRVQAGDSESFSLLVDKYHNHLLNFIYHLTGDEKTVEDLGQEVFLSVYRSIRNFDVQRGTPFSAWLFMSARNRCISEIRKRRDKIAVPIDDVSDLRDPRLSAEDMLIDCEQESMLISTLDLLEEPYRSSLLLSLKGDSLEEISLHQQVSVGTVKSRLYRAREWIRQYLRNHPGGNGYERI
jgi:RNA polymerase sigma-70 factor, ECF subfamily